jgi:hypothetical protein
LRELLIPDKYGAKSFKQEIYAVQGYLWN